MIRYSVGNDNHNNDDNDKKIMIMIISMKKKLFQKEKLYTLAQAQEHQSGEFQEFVSLCNSNWLRLKY